MGDDILTNEDVQSNYYGPVSSSGSSGPINIAGDYQRIISGGGSSLPSLEYERGRQGILTDAMRDRAQNASAQAEMDRWLRGGGYANGGYPGGFPGETTREAVTREAKSSSDWQAGIDKSRAYNAGVNSSVARSSGTGGNSRGVTGGQQTGGSSAPTDRAYYDYLMKLERERQASTPAAPTMAVPGTADINKLRHMGPVNTMRNMASRTLPSLSGLPIAARKQLTNSTMSGFSDNVSKMMSSIIADATNRAWQNAQTKYQSDVTGYNTALQNIQGPLAVKTAAARQGIYDING